MLIVSVWRSQQNVNRINEKEITGKMKFHGLLMRTDAERLNSCRTKYKNEFFVLSICATVAHTDIGEN